ncbi:ParA family protein [Halorubrum trueperi]|uniref:ParA family protein n=1 Tax=Halorubrum trueperi TaxID=2004704 RepID=A0ABD5UQQ2_9EURY
MHTTTLALVGAAGGAGTTRTAVELAAMGARGGQNVAVVDAAFTTQGLSEYATGRIGTDLTALITDETEVSLSAATYPLDGGGDERPEHRGGSPGRVDSPGRADAIPARAPFERVARAKTAEAARKLERRIGEAATAYDAVIVDAAPAGSNEAVAAVTAADRVETVRPATAHGRDALQRLRGRIADVGGTVDGSIAVRAGIGSGTETDGDAEIEDADTVLPAIDPAIAAAPTATTATGEYARAIADAYERAFDTSLGIEFEDPGLIDRLKPSN